MTCSGKHLNCVNSSWLTQEHKAKNYRKSLIKSIDIGAGKFVMHLEVPMFCPQHPCEKLNIYLQTGKWRENASLELSGKSHFTMISKYTCTLIAWTVIYMYVHKYTLFLSHCTLREIFQILLYWLVLRYSVWIFFLNLQVMEVNKVCNYSDM